jgi:hypothetical protein
MLEVNSTYSTFALSHIFGSLELLRIAQCECTMQHPSHSQGQIYLKCMNYAWNGIHLLHINPLTHPRSAQTTQNCSIPLQIPTSKPYPKLKSTSKGKRQLQIKMAWSIVWTYRQWSSSEPPCICHIEVRLCVNWTNSYPNLNLFNSYLNLRELKPYIAFTKGKSQILLTCHVCSWMFPILWQMLMSSASTPGSYTPHVSIASNYEIWDLMQQHITHTHTHKQPNKFPIVFAGVCLAVMICLSNCFQLSLQKLFSWVYPKARRCGWVDWKFGGSETKKFPEQIGWKRLDGISWMWMKSRETPWMGRSRPCPGRFWAQSVGRDRCSGRFLGRIGQNGSVSKSNRLQSCDLSALLW